MLTELRAEVAYCRLAEVHIAHFGLGNVLADDSYEGRERKHLSIETRETGEVTYFFHDCVDTRKFDDSSTIGGTFNNRQLKIVSLPLQGCI